jgi:hypothetical protein
MLKGISLKLGEKNQWSHHENLPRSFRMVTAGSSGCGKSTLLMRALLELDFIDYDSLHVFTTTPKQDIYQFLYWGFYYGLSKESLSSILLHQDTFANLPIPILMKKYSEISQLSRSNITMALYEKMEDIVRPENLPKDKKNLVVWDDAISLLNQSVAESYFIKARHHSCNVIYLTQSFFNLHV